MRHLRVCSVTQSSHTHLGLPALILARALVASVRTLGCDASTRFAPRWNRAWLVSCLSFCLILGGHLPTHAGPVLINEIMFHPVSHRVVDEYLELHNPGPGDIDLFGWRFDQGIGFSFTNHSMIPAGGFLIVAADPTAFALSYPTVTNVVGPWSGSLANSGESIRLLNLDGQPSDLVRYADSGEFATRAEASALGYRGWFYRSGADGVGPSLERIAGDRDGTLGANWAPSIPPGGSPGRPNTRQQVDLGPVISEVVHAPGIPRSTDPVTILATVGASPGSRLSVSAFYRVASIATPGSFVEIPMVDDGTANDGFAGDGRFGAILPSQPHRTVVEFYVQATTAEGLSRTFPPPALDRFGVGGQYANALYQVDNSTHDGPQPLYSLVLTETDRAILANPPGNFRYSDDELNATFISREGDRMEIRYGCGVRLRGASSRSLNPPNYRLNIPTDRRWKGLSALSLNIFRVHSQVAGYALAARAGLVTEEHRPVQVRVNGANLATAAEPPLGVYAHAEAPGTDFAENHFPLDPDGNLYRGSSHSATLDYLGANPLAYRNAGYSKSTHQSEDDWTDLIQLTERLAVANEQAYVSQIAEVVNIPQWLTYFAVFALTGSTETSLGTGVGDDYSMYRGIRDRRFQLIGHDWDSVLGMESDFTGGLFSATALPSIARFLRHPQIAPQYYAELLKQLAGTFSPGAVSRVLDEVLGGWVPPGTVTAMKRFGTNRYDNVVGQIPIDLRWRGGTTTNATSSGIPGFRTNSVLLWGTSHAAKTRQVLVNGTTSDWTAWVARWTNRISLHNGLNSLLFQSLDENGREFERTSSLVWVTNGPLTQLTGTQASDRTLNLAGAPYQVTGDWTIAPGATLTIQPGVTLIFRPGSRLTVRGNLVANGQPTQPIFLTKDANEAGFSVWGGLLFDQPGSTQRLSNVHLIGAGADGAGIRATNTTLLIDHLTVQSTRHPSVAFGDCSVTLSESVFSGDSRSTTLAGARIPPGGQVVIVSNLFHRLDAGQDVIRFQDARRPGSILQLLDNQFLGTPDDLVELRNADAHVEGNLFANVSQSGNPPGDLAAAVAILASPGVIPDVTCARNIFLRCDHGILCRDGSHVVAEQNTFQWLTHAAISFDEPELRSEGAQPGRGARFQGNIVWETPTNFLYARTADSEFGTTELQVDYCLVSGPDLPGSAPSVLREDPRFASPHPLLTDPRRLRDAINLLPGSPALGAAADGRDLGATHEGGLSVRGEPTARTALSSARLDVSGPGYVQYRYALNAGDWSTPQPLGEPILLSHLSPGDQQISLRGQNSAGVWDIVPTRSKSWVVDPSASQLVINEVLTRNQTAFPFQGRYPDAIELYYTGSDSLDLSGLGLTDDPADPHRFRFPVGTRIGPGEYLVVFADSAKDGQLHTSFRLNGQGGSLFLFGAEEANPQRLDEVLYGFQIPDFSVGRLTDGRWGLTVPSLGQANIGARTGDAGRVLLNEWLAEDSTADFVELYNPDPLPVELSGLVLTDDPIAYPRRYAFPSLSFVEGSGLQLILAGGQTPASPTELNFKLAPGNGTLSLHSPSGATIDCFTYQNQNFGISQGRSPDGDARLALFSEPTPGGPNPAPPLPFTSLITNYTATLINLTNASWRYRDDDVDLVTSWRAPDYNDSSWALGTGLFGVEDCGCLPAPIKTPLALLRPDESGPVSTYYFRTTFVIPSFFTTNPVFTASMVYDDGVAVYANGRVINRLGLPSGFLHTTPAGFPVAPEGRLVTNTLTITNLVAGTNSIAIEVHQSTDNAGDVLLGFGLQVSRSVTNFQSNQKVLLNEILARNFTLTNLDGTTPDWVEIYNPSPTQESDLTGIGLSDTPTLPRRWVFPAGTKLAAGGRRVIFLDPARPASVQDEENLNAGFGLDADGDRLLLFDSSAAGGGLLDGISFGPQAGDFSIGRVSPTSVAWELNVPSPGLPNIPAELGDPSALRLNEWMAAPLSGDDWFELFNSSILPVALEGLYLTDNSGQPTQHRIGSLSFIGPGVRGGYLQFHADGSPEQGAAHVGFKLSAGGEQLGLYAADGATPLDLLVFGSQAPGISEGRLPDGAANIRRFPRTPSPGLPNVVPFSAVRLNEVILRRPEGPAIELHNRTDSPQHLGGWWLSTEERDPRQLPLPAHTILPPGGFLVLGTADLVAQPGNGRSLFLDPARGGSLFLHGVAESGELSGLRAEAKWEATDLGLSVGPVPTSLGVDYPLLTSPSLGTTNAAPRISPVVINEIHYHPTGGAVDLELDEYIELFNRTAGEVPFYASSGDRTNTWHLRSAVDFDFPPETSVAANEFLLVVGFDPSTNAAQTGSFRTRFNVPSTTRIFGPWVGRLDNAAEAVELNYPTAAVGVRTPRALADRVAYRDSAPWATGADGQGSGLGGSLQRRSPTSYGNEPTNWVAAVPTPGRSNRSALVPPPVITLSPADQARSIGQSAAFSVTATGSAPMVYQWRFEGLDIPNATNASLALNSVGLADEGAYSVRISNAGGAAHSIQARLRLNQPPVITRQPASQVVTLGTNVILSVGIAGSSPLSIAWNRNGVILPGETNQLLKLTGLKATDLGSYQAVVTNRYGVATSEFAVLEIEEVPSFLQQPQPSSLVVNEGQPATFTARAAGSSPLHFQWQLNGLPIRNATNQILTLTRAQLSDSGIYTLLAANQAGSLLSDPVILTVRVAPVLSIRSSTLPVPEGGAGVGTFLISRSGTNDTPFPLTLGWSGTAVVGLDFEPLPEEIVLPAGTDSLELTVRVKDDLEREPLESVSLSLLASPNYQLSTNRTATFFIVDDDNHPPLISALQPPPLLHLPFSPTNLLLEVSVIDPDPGDSATNVVMAANDTELLGLWTQPPYAVTWTNLQSGSNTVLVYAVDRLGSAAISNVFSIYVNIPPVGAFQRPTDGESFPANVSVVPVRATAQDPDGSIRQVQFFHGTKLLSTLTQPPFELNLPNPPVGNQAVTMVITDNEGQVSKPVERRFAVGVKPEIFTDGFAGRGVITRSNWTLRFPNSNATLENSEPIPYADSGSERSLWIEWVAPLDGICRLDTIGSRTSGASSLDALLAVYLGTQLNGLWEYASDDDSGNDPAGFGASFLSFACERGVSYLIRVSAYGPGTLQVNCATEPSEILTVPGDAMEAPELTWRTLRNTPWSSQTALTSDGVDALRVADTSDQTASWIETTIDGPALLSFQWRFRGRSTSSFFNSTTVADRLALRMGGSNILTHTRQNAWVQATVALPPGPQTLRWVLLATTSSNPTVREALLDQVKVSRTRLGTIEFLTPESAAITLQGAPGTRFTIEISENLSQWVVFATESFAPDGTFRFAVPYLGEKRPRQFFRCRQSP